MAFTLSQVVRGSSADLSLRELLVQPVTELLGVGAEAAQALHGIQVDTIFDLGSSGVFAKAAAVLAAAGSDLALIPGDVIDPAGTPATAATAPDLPLDRLQGVSAAAATALADALEAPTIRDFALWPPRQVAHQLVGVASGTDLTVEDTAEELRPTLGEYPTERVYYDTLIMLGSQAPPQQTPLSKPLSWDRLAGAGPVFGAPMVGALATYAQSWYAQAVTLGHMVHSLALAPGEATRIAVIDWSRRTTASASESIEESEQLASATTHARAVSEVQNAVAEEMQSGGSMSTGWASSSSSASGFAASVGGGLAGVVGGIAGALGFGGGGSSSSQESETSSSATSASWSVGSRSVMAEMEQRVNDRTEQHATSVRNRRASAVREVSQSEHEEVSTRIVANYNHMHALTVQYYEVVQIYRVSVQLNGFVRALFVPFELLDFTGANAADIVARFRGELLAAALTERSAQLLRDDRGRIEVRSSVRVLLPITVGDVEVAAGVSAVALARRGGPPIGGTVRGASGGPVVGGTTAGDPAAPSGGGAAAPTSVLRRFSVVRPGPLAEVLPGDARLISISFEDVAVDRVRIDQAGVAAEASTFVVPPTTDQVDLPQPIPLRTIQSVHLARTDGETVSEGSMVLGYESEGHRSLAVVPLSLVAGTAMQKVAFVSGDASDRRAELHAHLQANRGHYTRAVLERLDSASLVTLLSEASWLGRPLVDQVEPHPIAVTGNFLVLRAPADDDDPSGVDGAATWGDLLRDRGIDLNRQESRLIPIPTGGVFAEAVLGRSNAAEKLDITRFWNWQDSPIPLQPTEIAPVATGSRATSEELLPGQLGAPVLNVQAPTSLPDPSGLGAALGALASANMFRDMSGLAGTQTTAQAASSGTLDAVTEAGRIASTNYQAATNQATEMGKAAADMWKTMKSSAGGGSGKAATGGISGDGARINHGRDMDRRGVSGGGSASAGGGTGGVRASGVTGPVEAPDHMPGPPPFLRELAYSDESSAVSPSMLAATSAALGVPLTPASFGGGLSALSNPLTAAQEAVEDLFFTAIRTAAGNIGISLQGVDLVPMRKHDNARDFEQAEFAAWTNSSARVYVDIGRLFKTTTTLAGAAHRTPKNILADCLAVAVYVLRHESQHVSQFAANNGSPPADFAAMIAFEEQAYGDDAVWLGSGSTQSFLLTTVGTEQALINDLIKIATSSEASFNTLATDATLTTNAARRDAMKVNDMLPAQLRGNPNYDVPALYRTKAP